VKTILKLKNMFEPGRMAFGGPEAVLPVPVPAGGLGPVVAELVLKERNRKDGLHYGKRH